MKFCPNCGTQLLDDAKFCFNCGSAVPSVEKAVSDVKEEVAAAAEEIVAPVAEAAAEIPEVKAPEIPEAPVEEIKEAVEEEVKETVFSAPEAPKPEAPAYQPPQPVYQPPIPPAQPAYQQPAQPTYQQPAQPAYQQPAQPTYQQPAAPTYQYAPQASSEPVRPKSSLALPILAIVFSVILIILAAVAADSYIDGMLACAIISIILLIPTFIFALIGLIKSIKGRRVIGIIFSAISLAVVLYIFFFTIGLFIGMASYL